MRIDWRRFGWQAARGAVALVLGTSSLAAQDAGAGAAGGGAEDLGRWATAHLDSLVETTGVPGAVFSMVSACSTVASEGFGSADRSAERPMDPTRTLVRIGSISKVLTATAAVQLAAEGAVDFERPVSAYLDGLELDWTYADPVTLHHLLTHTSGITDRFAGSGAPRAAEQRPLVDYFATALPVQLRRPGEVKIYSSHGIALAGLVVERVSGLPFAEYMDRRVFSPLGMERTSFDIPAGDPDLAVGYKGSGAPLSPDYHFHIAPGADAVTTAEDMARFLRSQLGCAGAETAPPLGPAGRALMQETRYRNAPALPGMAYGWEEWWHNGERWLKKSGDAPGFMGITAIQPERGIGFFLAYNVDRHPLHMMFLYALAERVGGDGEAPVAGSDDGPADSVRLSGWYRHLRYDPESWEKVIPLAMGGVVKVEAGADGALRLGGRSYEPAGGLTFVRPEGSGRIAFRAGKGGTAAYLFINGSDGYERLAWYETPPVQQGLLLGAVAVFLLVILAWVVARLRRRVARPLGLAAVASLLNLAFLVGFALVLTRTEVWDVHFGTPPLLTAVSVLPVAAALLFGALLVGRWRQRGGVRTGRGTAVLVAAVLVAEAAFVWLLGYWKLFGLLV